MRRNIARVVALTLACFLALAPVPSAAIAPVLLVLIKQIVKDAAQSMLKDMVLSTLNGMGCKGIAIANALQALDLRKGAGGGMAGLIGGAGKLPGGAVPGLPAGMGVPGMPAGMTVPGMPPGMAIPGMPPGMAVPGMPPGLAMPGLPGGASIPGLPALPGGGRGLGALDGGELMARMRSMMAAGQIPSDIDPEQITRLMQAMSQPLTPPETLAVMDEMTEIGFLPKAMHAELKECMVLLPAAAPALGMGMGMMKTMLPQLRQARDQLHALSPAEQDELVAALAPEMKTLAADERKAFLDFLDGGFFPQRVAEGLRAQLGGR
jgi:hypothetical protein